MVALKRKIWILTDGKPGDLNQCLGVAERLQGQIETRKVAPSPPWVWAMPWGPVPFSDHPRYNTSPLHGPPPDIAIASGRRTVPYLRKLKQISPQTVTVFLKDPRTDASQCRSDLGALSRQETRLKRVSHLDRAAPLDRASFKRRCKQGACSHPPSARPKGCADFGGRHGERTIWQSCKPPTGAVFKTGSAAATCRVMVTPSRRTPDHLLAGRRASVAIETPLDLGWRRRQSLFHNAGTGRRYYRHR